MSSTLAFDIRDGKYDEDFAEIAEAVKQRGADLARIRAVSLRPNDTVHFSDAIRPRYLVGKEATVVRVNQSSVTVSCPDDPSYQRYSGARNVRCPNELIAETAALAV